MRSDGNEYGRVLRLAVIPIVIATFACGLLSKPTPTAPNTAQPGVPSQSTEVPAETTQPSGTSQGSLFTIIPFDYTLKDAGDGWNQGQVWIAFQNQTDKILNMTSPMNFSNGITVKTAEGPTYPATLGRLDATGVGGPYTSIDFSPFWNVPPGFRFSVYEDAIGADYNYVIVWKSALAATPESIQFADYPGLSFDLPSQNTSLQFPFNSAPIKLESIADLKGSFFHEEDNGLMVEFTGKCGNAKYFNPGAATNPNTLYIEFQVQNKDSFNQHDLPFELPVSDFYHDQHRFGLNGLLWHFDSVFTYTPGSMDQSDSISIGPAQNRLGYATITRDFPWETVQPPIVVLWQPDGSAYQALDASQGCTIIP